MSTHNIGFNEEMVKNIFQLSSNIISNIIKYALYLFFCPTFEKLAQYKGRRDQHIAFRCQKLK